MTWIRVVEEHEAEGAVKTVYDTHRQKQGFVPGIIKATSLRPEVLEKLDALRHSLIFGASRLGRRREEMIAVVVSGLNDCDF